MLIQKNFQRPIKTILRENWGLVEKIDAKLKDADTSKNLKPVPAHLAQNFLSTLSVLVNPRKLWRSKSEPPEDEVSDFENDLRDAQRVSLLGSADRNSGEEIIIFRIGEVSSTNMRGRFMTLQ